MELCVAGIDRWAAGIRGRMANDPGRQDLEDHILCNGFLFLDEYLEDILMGARTDPIIELTKTPGRRKDASKRDRVATVVSDKRLPSQSPDKENISALQSSVVAKKVPTPFQQALLKAGRENQQPLVTITPSYSSRSLDYDSGNPFHRDIGFLTRTDRKEGQEAAQEEVQEEEAVKRLVTPPQTRVPASAGSEGVAYPSILEGLPDADITSPVIPSVELSTITEGDENELSRVSLPSSRLLHPIIHPIIHNKEKSDQVPTVPNKADGPTSTVVASHDPLGGDEDDTQTFPVGLDRTFNDSEPTSTASSFPIDPYARDYETHELPQVVAEHSAELLEQCTPSSPSGTLLTRKASVPVLPSLPDPSPLRKSIRDSLAIGPTAGGTRTNAPRTVAGTRSSWLNKARDVTAKRTSVVSGIKRKSSEQIAEADYTTPLDDYARATKVAKTNAEGSIADVLSNKDKSQGRSGIQPFRAVLPAQTKEPPVSSVVHAANLDDNSEGMMHILKRTVEGLGTRVGKGLGKSLGGTAAAVAAAEAKAAAEARLAQREAKGSDESRHARLSVSELVGTFESGYLDKGVERVSPDTNLKSTSPNLVSLASRAEQDVDLTTKILHDSEMEDSEINRGSAHTSSDPTETKFKAGSSQDLSTTSTQGNLIAQASTLLSKVVSSTVGNALNSSKRGKLEPLKSIQLAAAAAKKQQEEAHRKAVRLKEMDKRRAAIASKKADQDATEKSKSEGNRYKRDREEGAERNVTKIAEKKVEEEAVKKRKVIVEIEKKPQGKNPLSKDKKDLAGSRVGKFALNTSLSQSQVAPGSMSKLFKQPSFTESVSQSSVTLVGSSQNESISVAVPSKIGSSNAKNKVLSSGLEDLRQPSEALHAQMQARVQAQMTQARHDGPLVPSESIELPDINSEYSDSDDENRPRTFDPPDWAQSPVLGQALQSQSRLNPDDIFGPVKPLRMEEIFKSRQSRFRARTSSANWVGTDELTIEEEREYAKRMGYN